MNRISTQRSAFSLVELAVVLAIIAVVAAFGVNIGRTAMQGAARNGTQEKLAVIKHALDQYAAIAGHYPCPAAPALPPTDAAFGVEQRNGTSGCYTSGNGLVNTANTLIGALPVRNLGLSDEYAADAWANKFLYAVSVNRVTSPASSLVGGYIEIRTGPLSGTNYPLTGTSDGAAGAGADYVVVSHGPNGEGAYPLHGTAIAISCGDRTDSVNCKRNSAVYYDNDYNDGAVAATFFDDFVVWGSNVTSGLAYAHSSCSSDCEAWCAPCTIRVGGVGNNYLCGKFITSITATSGSCEATCMMAESAAQCP